MGDVDSRIKEAIARLTGGRYAVDPLLNAVLCLFVGVWFLKEIFVPSLLNGFANLTFNVAVISLSVLTLANNSPARPQLFAYASQVKDELVSGSDWIILFFLLLFGTEMALVVEWDLPYHFHPGDDEYIVPSMYLSQFDVHQVITNPNRSQNPLYENQHLMYFILGPYFLILRLVGLVSVPADYYFAARVLNVLFAGLILLLTYFSAKAIGGRRAAAVSVLLLVISRQFLNYSLFMRSDIILTLLVLGCFTIYILQDSATVTDYLSIGALLGLATALKPYSLLFLLPFGTYILIESRFLDRPTEFTSKSAAVLAPLILFFQLGRSYHNFYNYTLGGGFHRAVETASSLDPRYPGSQTSLQNLAFTLEFEGWWQGEAFVLLVVLAIGFLLYRHEQRGDVILPVFVLPYFVYMGSRNVISGKFFLVLLPYVSIAGGLFFSRVVSSRLTVNRVAVALLLLACTSQMAFISGAWVNSLTDEDIRVESAEWVRENVEEGSHVSISGRTSWQEPPISGERYAVHRENANTDYLVVLVSDYHRYRYYIENNYTRGEMARYFGEVPTRRLEMTREVFYERDGSVSIDGRRYILVKQFRNNQSLFGMSRSDYRTHPATWDIWAIVNPIEIKIYRRAEVDSG